jgi:exopolysaccharide biosynthesis polyprenyl glycosylphosphotransferase
MSTTNLELTHAQPAARAVPQLRRARRRARASWGQISLATDAAMLIAAVALVELTSPGRIPATPVPWIVAFALLVFAFLYARGMYRSPLHLRMLDGTRAVITASALATAIVVSLRVFLADSSFVAAQSVRLWLFATVCLAAGRVLLSLTERRARRAGEAGRPTLIVGAGKVGRLVAKRLREHPEIGLRPVGFLDKEPLDVGGESGLPVLGASWDLERVVEENEIEHVAVTFSTAPTEVLLGLLRRCEQLGIRTSFVPRLFERATEQFTVERLGGLSLIVSHSPHPKGWQFAVKYAVDRAAAALALALLSPVMGALAIAVFLSAGRPVLYRQERIGRDGRRFDMLKFRSMRGSVDPEECDVVVEADTAPGGVEGVDRRTWIGTIMRRTSLDELPQLFNVLKGEMSFVGPRPERPEFVEIFEQDVYRYEERHRVKSGITGWAQVSGLRGKTSIGDRVEWDNHYIENWSLWFDVKILLLTLVAVARPGDVE